MFRVFTVMMLCLTAVTCTRAPVPDRAAGTPSPAPPTAPPGPTPSADPFALARELEAPDPAALAARLTDAGRVITDPNTTASSLVAAGRTEQAASRQLVVRPEWRSEVYGELPDGLQSRLEANVEAGADLRALTQPRDALPDHWRIVAPAPAAELRAHYEEAGREFGIGWEYLAAIHLVETRMGRIRGESTAGALGPMQFLPGTWQRWGEGDIESNADSIRAAARYLAASGAPGDMDRALFAYNRSNRYVRAVQRYAAVMRGDPRTYGLYHAWEVYYRTTDGDALLPVGWGEPA